MTTASRPVCDVTAPRSAATDTRAERRRFVTNACVYATFVRGIRLRVIDRVELEGLLGRELSQYKKELLGLFGRHGYIRHALHAGSDAGVFHRARFRQRTPGILGSER